MIYKTVHINDFGEAVWEYFRWTGGDFELMVVNIISEEEEWIIPM